LKTSSFAIRSLYTIAIAQDGTYLYEERVVHFSGKTEAEALAKAEMESMDRADHLEIDVYGERLICQIDHLNLADGVELWSDEMQSPLEVDEFYQQKYSRFEPEDGR